MRAEVTDGRSLRAQGKRRARRKEILLAAQKTIGRNGYHATSVADVIEAAGVSRGTFYLYFESREALFHELVDGFIEDLVNCIELVGRDGKPIEGLYENLLRVIDLLFENRNLTVILLREAVGLDAKTDQKLNELNEFLLRMVEGALRNGASWGLTRKVNEPIVAMAIVGCIKEVLYQYLVVNHKTVPDRETLAQELLQFGLTGLKDTL